MNNTENNVEIKRAIWPRIIVSVLILGLAGSVFILLAKSKKNPQKKVKQERAIQVEALAVSRSDYPVLLTSHGELKSLRTVTLSSEVAGKILKIHPSLTSGEIIKKGELLVEIDDADYAIDHEFNKKRQVLMANDLELARKELARVKNLYDKNKVGSVASVEASERAVNIAAEKLALIEQSIKRAIINLDRCRIYAPFTCRIISHHVEEDQYVTPGMQIAVLADDSILEVELPLYGKDGVRWLRLNNEKPSKPNWFGSPEKVDITLNWTEEPDVFFRARLNRIASYTPETRSMTVVAQVSPGPQNTPFQLVPGMFVRATIPGKNMSGVIELPRSAVSFENRALVIRDNRLYSTDVEVIRIQNDHAYITGGVDEGDTVITTRLANPLEGSLVEVVELAKGAP